MGEYDRGLLTESMFYTLLALKNGEKCGTQIAQYVKDISDKRVGIGPGTLYTILNKFEKEKLISETYKEGRKRTYVLTQIGLNVYNQELDRLKKCISDSQR